MHMTFHWPRAKSALSVGVGVGLFFVSISPQDAIANVQKTVEFLGFGVPRWFAAASLSAFIRWALAAAALILVVWGVWPSRKRDEPPSVAEPAPAPAPDPMERAAAALVDAQRPWIALDIGPVGNLAYDEEGWGAGPRWHVPIRCSVRNTGPTVANSVDVFATMVALEMNHFTDMHPNGLPVWPMTPGTDVDALIEEVCAFPELSRAHGEEHGHKTGVDLPPGHGADRVIHLNGNPAKFQASKGYTGQFLLVACATYTSPLLAQPLRTTKAFNLYKVRGDISLNGEVVPLAELRMAPHPRNPGYSR